VVVKPDWSGRGADVRIMRKGRVRWRPPTTDYTRTTTGQNQNWIVQDFVYTGLRPVSYRVATFFGEPLWALKVEADPSRRELRHRTDFGGGEEAGGGMSIVASGRGCVFSLISDPELLSPAARAHQAFPGVPLLGVDILHDVETGRLDVIEVNSAGLTWHLTSPIGLKIQQEFGFSLDSQFDARRTAARVLVDQVRRNAT